MADSKIGGGIISDEPGASCSDSKSECSQEYLKTTQNNLQNTKDKLTHFKGPPSTTHDEIGKFKNLHQKHIFNYSNRQADMTENGSINNYGPLHS